MLFSEDDIDFGTLSSTDFESLCYDLLQQQGFHGLRWNQGGADHGRDIEAHLTVNNSLVGSYTEKWFIECKNWNQGLPVTEISSKFDWAEAERAKHLVVMTGAYLTTATNDWVNKRLTKCSFHFHEINGKKLKQLLLLPDHQSIIESWFIKGPVKMLRDDFQKWRDYGLLPDYKVFNFFHENLELNNLTTAQIAFLWIMCVFKADGQDELGVAQSRKIYERFRDQSIAIFSKSSPGVDSILQSKSWHVRKMTTVEETCEFGETVLTTVKVWLYPPDDMNTSDTLYFCKRFSAHSGIEILLSPDESIAPQIQYYGFDPVPRSRKLLKLL
jgi:hypothetical protein